MWNTAGREPAFVGSALSVLRVSLGPVPSRRTLLGGGWWRRSADPVAELPGLIRAIDDRRSLVTRLMIGPVDLLIVPPGSAEAGALGAMDLAAQRMRPNDRR